MGSIMWKVARHVTMICCHQEKKTTACTPRAPDSEASQVDVLEGGCVVAWAREGVWVGEGVCVC
eukprot:2532878-Rhodomonas_salina.5